MASSVIGPGIPRGENGINDAHGLKRKQSDASDQENKKQRISPGKSSPPATTEGVEAPPPEAKGADTAASEPPADAQPARKKSVVTDEKQRSKRLFGALLGNLNRPSDRVSKRRTEIEQRRKAELQKQDDERLEDRQRRRKREQIDVDEEIMRTRHENMLHTANFLQTKSEPKIYYRPWDLLSDEEDRIDDQIDDAKQQIEKEVAEFEVEKRRRLKELGESEEQDHATAAKSDDAALEKDDAPPEPVGSADQQASPEPSKNVAKDADGQETADLGTNKDATDEVVKDEMPVANVEEQVSPEVESKAEGVVEKEEAEEEGENVVVGDEDTVEY